MRQPTPSPDPDSLQSRKQEFIRGEISTAAMDLFIDLGYDETTIEQIADRAKVSRRTFFRYFSSKHDVMAGAMASYGSALMQALSNQPAESAPFEAARAVVKLVASQAAAYPKVDRGIQIARRSPAARSAQLLQLPVIEDDLAKIFAARSPAGAKPSFTPRLLANMTLHATSLAIVTWVDHREEPIANIVDQIFKELTTITHPQI